MKLSERKTLQKKEQILLKAITVVNRRGYEGTTMEEIAAEHLMTKGSLYYYFKNKGDLMYQCHSYVLSQAARELEDALNGDGTVEEILRRMIAIHIDHAIEEKETNNLIIEPENIFKDEQLKPVLELRKQYSSLFDQLFEKGIASGEFIVEDPKFVRMMVLGAMNWIQQWYRPNGRMTKDEIKIKFGDYILKLLK